ncbi:MAG: molybdopterin molybdotransferase MoeA [Planctomycetia bacterium]|nr:molybdopterin molybdotransferase MoeA [Planctomycetia bacterium]
MIDLDKALELVERTAVTLSPRRQRLLDAVGQRLAAAVVSDVDSPPWDRAMMDGFAVRSCDLADRPAGPVELDVIVDLAAGDVTTLEISGGTCARIMTGAPLPPGADAVVPIESAIDGTATVHAGGRVRLQEPRFRPGQHVGRRAAAFRAGQEILPAGVVLTAAGVGLAAEAGATHVCAAARPRVAILSTGSELVSPEVVPAHGQTRNSNGPMLAAAVASLAAEPIPLGLAADRPEAIRAAVAQGLAADVLILSGGVSAGDLDLVPAIFAACGVEQVFHKVRLKPGKPVWFGRLDRGPGQSPTLVFGLPGNPASSLVCFELFVRPAVAILAGRPRDVWHLPRCRGVLTSPAKFAADRPIYLPCRIVRSGGQLDVTPLPWTGSSDLVGLAMADGLLSLPAGGPADAGCGVEVLLMERSGRTTPLTP